MDGSEKTTVPVSPTISEPLSQPKVIVERIQEVNMDKVLVVEEVLAEDVAEDVMEEEEAEDTSEQNGQVTKPTLNDLIQEAISPDDQKPEEDGEEATAEEEDASAVPALPVERKKKEPLMDVNQCRCCRNRDDLLDIFGPLKEGTDETRICDNIKKICTNVTITKRDHLPHLICKNCLDKLQIALDFKSLCEQTEREMRENLPRSTAKSRKGNYTIIDYESSEHEEKEDDGARSEDEDFKLSDVVSSKSSDSDVSFTEAPKPSPKKRGRKPKAKPPVVVAQTPLRATPRPRGRPRKNANAATPAKRPAEIVYVDTKKMVYSDTSEEEESEEEVQVVRPPVKKVAVSPKVSLPPVPKTPPKTCPKCKGPITRGIHKCKMGFACSFCVENFPTHAVYMNHQQLHSNFQAVHACIKCHKKLASRLELRKHQTSVKCTKATKNDCPQCHRTLINASQLAIHLQKCNATGTLTPVAKKPATSPAKKSTPEDIFKYVAPNTSTYWSDSFSD